MSENVEMAAVESRQIPEPKISGTFAIYDDPDGGLVLVADITGQGVSRRKIPAALVNMMTGDAGGPMAKMFRRAFGGE